VAAADVALALMALDNEDAHWEVGQEDFARFDAFELSHEERRLLTGATVEVPRRDDKVAVPFRPKDDPGDLSGPGGVERGFGYWPPGTAEAIRYVQAGLDDPRLQACFVAWQERCIDNLP
jgi:hypothetical protein